VYDQTHTQRENPHADTILLVCVNCHEQPYNSAERLCDKCLRKLERVECSYCCIDFHQLSVDAESQRTPACHECGKKASAFGAPSACAYCNVVAAWSGGKCSRCERLELEHGPPQACAECKLVCAFDKDEAQRAKVDGLLLCFLCTRKYKRRRHDEERKSATASSRTAEQWKAACDELQRRIAAVKKQSAADLKQAAAETAALVAPLTALLEQARLDEANAARELRDADKHYAPLSTETYALEMRLRSLQNDCDSLTSQCSQMSADIGRLSDTTITASSTTSSTATSTATTTATTIGGNNSNTMRQDSRSLL
jgi:hypothetical protein